MFNPQRCTRRCSAVRKAHYELMSSCRLNWSGLWMWQTSSPRNEHYEPSGKHLVHKLRPGSPPASCDQRAQPRPALRRILLVGDAADEDLVRPRARHRRRSEAQRAQGCKISQLAYLEGGVEVNGAHSEPFVRRTGTVELAPAPLHVQRHAAYPRVFSGAVRSVVLPGFHEQLPARESPMATVRDSWPQDL